MNYNLLIGMLIDGILIFLVGFYIGYCEGKRKNKIRRNGK